MGEVIVVTSGKGGVGKTTTTANLGTGFALQGKKVALVDADIGLRNLDVVMGLENRIVYHLVDVVEGNCRLKQAMIRDKRYETLFLLPAAQTRDKSAVNPEQMKALCEELRQEFDYVLDGQLKISLGGNDLFLKAGDSIYYDSSIPHVMYALEGDCRFIAVVVKEGARA